MKVIKAINNNNLCVLDEHGKEQIVSGKESVSERNTVMR